MKGTRSSHTQNKAIHVEDLGIPSNTGQGQLFPIIHNPAEVKSQYTSTKCKIREKALFMGYFSSRPPFSHAGASLTQILGDCRNVWEGKERQIW